MHCLVWFCRKTLSYWSMVVWTRSMMKSVCFMVNSCPSCLMWELPLRSWEAVNTSLTLGAVPVFFTGSCNSTWQKPSLYLDNVNSCILVATIPFMCKMIKSVLAEHLWSQLVKWVIETRFNWLSYQVSDRRAHCEIPLLSKMAMVILTLLATCNTSDYGIFCDGLFQGTNILFHNSFDFTCMVVSRKWCWGGFLFSLMLNYYGILQDSILSPRLLDIYVNRHGEVIKYWVCVTSI